MWNLLYLRHVKLPGLGDPSAMDSSPVQVFQGKPPPASTPGNTQENFPEICRKKAAGTGRRGTKVVFLLGMKHVVSCLSKAGGKFVQSCHVSWA